MVPVLQFVPFEHAGPHASYVTAYAIPPDHDQPDPGREDYPLPAQASPWSQGGTATATPARPILQRSSPVTSVPWQTRWSERWRDYSGGAISTAWTWPANVPIEQ